jgi:hypothetical protein
MSCVEVQDGLILANRERTGKSLSELVKGHKK